MAAITLTGTPSLATQNPPTNVQLTLEAAVDITAGHMVYITSAGKFDKANGTANDALALWWGAALRTCKAGQPLTAAHSVEIRYGAGLTPGVRGFLATTAGLLADTATTGGDVPCCIVTTATTIYILPPTKDTA